MQEFENFLELKLNRVVAAGVEISKTMTNF
jgi:hypothetical protein